MASSSADSLKRNAIDDVFLATGGGARKVRRRGDPSVHAMVASALRDNCKGFHPEQIDGIRIDGAVGPIGMIRIGTLVELHCFQACSH